MEQTVVLETARRGVDRGMALTMTGDDLPLLAELAALFLETTPQYLAQIRAAVDGREARDLERAAHALKGSVGNFGAQAAYEAAWLLEEIGRSGDLAQSAMALAALETELSYVAVDLEAIIAEAGQ